MSAATQSTDGRGCHWHSQGESGQILDRRTGEPVAAFTAHTVRHPQMVQGRPHVLLEVVRDPATFAARMSARDARALAESLMKAADRAEGLAYSKGLQP